MDRQIQVPLRDEDIRSLKAGDYVYLSGTVYTARGRRPQKNAGGPWGRETSFLSPWIIP